MIFLNETGASLHLGLCCRMADLGRRNRLTVTSKTEKGLVYLDGGLHGQILIPGIYLPEGGVRIGDQLEVFVYRDTEDRLVATTETPIAMVGEFGCFSFFPSKNLGGFGDGGLVTARHEAGADQLRMLRNHGSRQRYYHDVIGYNSRLDEIQAAILRVKLRHLDDFNAQRRFADTI